MIFLIFLSFFENFRVFKILEKWHFRFLSPSFEFFYFEFFYRTTLNISICNSTISRLIFAKNLLIYLVIEDNK